MPAIVLALFLVLAQRPGRAARCRARPPGQPPQVLDAGKIHTCALTPSGAADCWGNNGNGPAADQPGPYTQISAADTHTCGLTPAGAADCWGIISTASRPTRQAPIARSAPASSTPAP